MSKPYDTDLNDGEPHLPAALPGGRPRTTNLRAVVNAIFYLLRTGCQWRLLPREFPPRSTVYHYFSLWRTQGVWTRLQWVLHKRVRAAAGRAECPTVVIMDGQSVKTTERGGTRGFDGHKRVKGRKRRVSRTHQKERRCGAVREMRVGPSGSAIRCWTQATASCCGQKPRW